MADKAPVQSTAPTTQASSTKLEIAKGDTGDKLTATLHTVALKQRETSTQQAAQKAGFPYMDLRSFPMTQESLKTVDEEDAKNAQAFVFYKSADEIRLAAVMPTSDVVKKLAEGIKAHANVTVSIYQISPESFRVGLERYKTLPKIVEFKDEVSIKEESLKRYRAMVTDSEKLNVELAKASITEVVAIIVAGALQLGSSDIHVEAQEKRIAMRLRIDGVLQEVAEIPKDRWKQMISRFKLVSGLKLNVTEKPQDGRFTIVEEGNKIDVRVSTMPTVFGESLVMRILKPLANVDFDGLGIVGNPFKKLSEQVSRPNGMIITTGPTGSGKTTTLYSILTKLNQPDVKIITMEDPVEYKLAGINQSQVDASRGYTFAKGLKSILRQDPDIVMVGEIRELETAEIAIQAALTGHLMISTIHTNSAAGAIPRFLSMGVKTFLLAPALNAIMGQRLARRLCKECKKPIQLDPDMQKKVEEHMAGLSPESGATWDPGAATWFGPGDGCDKCSEGYKGRLGIYEVLIVTKEIEKTILADKISEYAIEDVAVKEGMIKMTQDGIMKAATGVTSLDEVFRVIE